DDSPMGSCPCPYAALLDGIPSRMLSARLVSLLCGLLVRRDRKGYVVTSTPEGQAWHLHGDGVVKDPRLSAPYPLQS
ncbi:MAG: hypothetical protein ACREOH_14405, partial [Candidatus Entotheonellia bacterium]